MNCSSAHQFQSETSGGTVEQQMNGSVGGVLGPLSSQYQMPMHQGSLVAQVGGKRRRTKKQMRRRSLKHKKRSYKKKSYKMSRRRK